MRCASDKAKNIFYVEDALKEYMKEYFNEDEDEIVYRYKLIPEVFGKG